MGKTDQESEMPRSSQPQRLNNVAHHFPMCYTEEVKRPMARERVGTVTAGLTGFAPIMHD